MHLIILIMLQRLLLLILPLISGAQDKTNTLSNVQFTHMLKVHARHEINIPDIMGYKALKCDFHMHTVFSDGKVWPTLRVDEAWEEGLDAISITDHIEYLPHKDYLKGDFNTSYNIAAYEAKEKDIILIRGAEVTRFMPPGHLNALFLNDVNPLYQEDVFAALTQAKQQGAFIIWNHPGWKNDQPDTCVWMPMHQKLYDNGLINGIEVFNDKEYYPVATDWCRERHLTFFANSDIHDVTASYYDLEKGHRPMTLVFAKQRNQESIKEALIQKRTVAFFDNKLAGNETLLKALFEASLSFKPSGIVNDQNKELIRITNSSAIQFELKGKTGDLLIIPAESTLLFTPNHNITGDIAVINCYTGSLSCLHVTLPF